DGLALLHLPLPDLALDDALADVWQLELEGHGYHSSVFSIAPRIRSAFGMYSCSRVYGNGVSKPVTRSMGASRCAIARSQIAAMSSPAKPQVRGASCAITQRPVFFTDAMMVSMSYGTMVRKSSTSTSMPFSCALSAASSAVWTIALHAMSVSCPPSRATFATPIGTS